MGTGLALSGGGLRATLFHLGVVRALRDANVLKDVTHICSVSGGSILAAHLVLHWEDYLGEGFEKRAGEILKFCAFDVRNHIFRRYPNLLARWFASRIVPFRLVTPKGATDLLQKYYGQLYGDATLDNLRAPPGKVRPVLHILTTNLTTGTLCSFGTDGFHSEAAAATGRRPQARFHITAATPTLSFAVSASSAFPGMFSPLRLTAAALGKYDAALEPSEQFVTDGGVYDNLGVRKFLSDPEDLSRLDRVYVSNAGLELKTGGGREHVGMVRTALRASDILSHRVHQLESASMAGLSGGTAGSKFVPIQIREVVPREEGADVLHENSQDWLRWIRTDLDRFSDFEMHCLIRHGWQVARKALRAAGVAVDAPAWSPVPAGGFPVDPVKQMNLLSKSVSRRMRLFSLKDGVSWVQAAVLLLVIGLGFGVYRAREKHVENLEKTAGDEKKAREKAEAETAAEKKRLEAENELQLAKQKELSEQIRRIDAAWRNAQFLAADKQHRLSVEIMHRRNKAGTAFKYDGQQEIETGKKTELMPEDEAERKRIEDERKNNEALASSSFVTLAIMQSLLRDDAQLSANLVDRQRTLLLGVFAPGRKDHNYRDSENLTFDSTEYRRRPWLWKFPTYGFSQIDPSAWCLSALSRFVEQGSGTESHEAAFGYWVGVLAGLNKFVGDREGVWLNVDDQEERKKTHPWASGLALLALMECEALVKSDPELQAKFRQWISHTCKALTEAWEADRWRVRRAGGGLETSEGLTLFAFAALLRVAIMDSDTARLPPAMIEDMKARIRAMAVPDYPGQDFNEMLTLPRAGGKAVATIDMTHNWLPWAIDCAHELSRWLDRYEKSNFEEIERTLNVLNQLLLKVTPGEIVKTETLAEYHLPMIFVLRGQLGMTAPADR